MSVLLEIMLWKCLYYLHIVNISVGFSLVFSNWFCHSWIVFYFFLKTTERHDLKKNTHLTLQVFFWCVLVLSVHSEPLQTPQLSGANSLGYVCNRFTELVFLQKHIFQYSQHHHGPRLLLLIQNGVLFRFHKFPFERSSSSGVYQLAWSFIMKDAVSERDFVTK